MIKKINGLIKNGALYIIAGSFLIKFIALFGSIFVVRLVSKEQYGILKYYENIVSYFILAAGLGLPSALIRYVVLAKDDEHQKECYRKSITIGTFWNIFLVVTGIIFMILYPHPESFHSGRLIGILLILSVPFVFLENASYSTLRALFKNKEYAIGSLAVVVLVVVCRIIGANLGEARGVACGKLIADLVCGMTLTLYLFGIVFARITPRKLEKQFLKEMRTYSVQMMLTDGLWTIFMLNDLFLLGQLTGSESIVADYSIAYVIPANLSVLTSSIGTYVSPYFTQKESDKNYAWIINNTIKVVLVTVGIMLLAIAFLAIFSYSIIGVIFGKNYLSCIPIMRMLLVASFFNCGIRSSFANIFSAIGLQKENIYVAIIGVIIQILLDIALIPRLGGLGVAISSCSVYVIMSILMIAFFYGWKKRMNSLEI